MIRRIIRIDSKACNGCGLCANACHEGAIGMRDGKAVLLRDDYCDGLGDCLPVCPTGAISFEEREAADYDEAAVKENMAKRGIVHAGCPGSAAHKIESAPAAASTPVQNQPVQSHLQQWPVQIKLLPVSAPYYDGANLLIAADCTAYARADFHQRFMQGKITVIGCPKLDSVDYSEKLTAILKENNIQSVTVLRMSVPCCGGLEHAALNALQNCGKEISYQIVTLGPDGSILSE